MARNKSTTILTELLTIKTRKLSAVRAAIRSLHVAYDKRTRELNNANEEIERLNSILKQNS